MNATGINLYEALQGRFTSLLRDIGKSSPEMISMKRESFSNFQQLGFPTIRNEEYRFTNILPHLPEMVSLPVPVSDDLIEELIREKTVPGMRSYLLVVVNGQLNRKHSNLPHEEIAGIESMSKLLYSPFLADDLDLDTTQHNAMAALNTAFFSDGLYINVRQHAHLDKPIQILNIFSAETEGFANPRNLIFVNKNAGVELLESTVTVSGGLLFAVNAVTQIVIGEQASVTHYQLQDNDFNDRVISQTFVSQAQDSQYNNFALSLPGAPLIRNTLEVDLKGEHTLTHLNGLYLAAGDQLIDNHTAIRHHFPNCESHELYKGVLTGYAKAVFNGKVLVKREAQKTNAFQQNNNLLLSDNAKINTKPQLEIFADDVKCSHGCTVGQFDPEAVFYLQSRGIGEENARKLMVEAFLFDVVERIANPALKKRVQQLLQTQLNKNEAQK